MTTTQCLKKNQKERVGIEQQKEDVMALSKQLVFTDAYLL